MIPEEDRKTPLDYIKLARYCRVIGDYADAEKYLKQAELNGFFDVVIGGDKVKVSKPEPDIFIYACERLNVSPMKALVLEDSENGIRAARAAGIPVICIPDLKEPSREVEKLVTAIVRR